MNEVLVIDNGSHSIKIGFSGEDSPRFCLPNCIGKVRRKDKIYISDQIFGLDEYFSYCPFSEGLLVDVSLQYDIWTYIFDKMNLSPNNLGIIVTEPFMNPTPLRHALYEMIFEQFHFQRAIISSPPNLAQFAFTPNNIPSIDIDRPNPCYLILDCGYQSCFSIPIYQGLPIKEGCRRIDIGGYHLDLSLKNSLSFRQIDLSRNSLLVSKIKEASCYVSCEFESEINSTKSNGSERLLEHFIKLPEQKGHSGNRNSNFYLCDHIAPTNSEVLENNKFIKENAEHLNEIQNKNVCKEYIRLHTERIFVPELLFNPNYYGYRFAGLAEMVVESILSCPSQMQEMLANNIVLIGGTTKFRNFEKRLRSDIISMLPSDWTVYIRSSERPEYSAWKGGSLWGELNFDAFAISRNQYNEEGKT
ncbi:actin family protein [Cryptosporidium ryanae]|uniref:actin family protein n=1 Tax=Cryptosporidium ryanae TaxID=515981 RepID=UPI00351A46DE|nr:actin family protein [Cryptosporidium ryanae]